MWFNNALIYHYDSNEDCFLNSSLLEHRLKPCPPHARFTYGWLPVYEDEFIQGTAGSSLICMGKEERILPRAVINKLLAEKIQLIEIEQNRKVKRAEISQLAVDLEFDLLPKSFSVQKKTYALLDHRSKKLVINTASTNQASQLISLLCKSIQGLSILPVTSTDNLAIRFAEWIQTPTTLPSQFQLASDCLLFSLDDERKRINCKGYDLPAEEILSLLSQGMATAEVSLIWKERIQMTLTHDFALKKLKSLDYLIDEMNEINKLDEERLQLDAALTLVAGELRELIGDLLTSFNPVQKLHENESSLEIQEIF